MRVHYNYGTGRSMQYGIGQWAKEYHANGFLIRQWTTRDSARLSKSRRKGFAFKELSTKPYQWEVRTPFQRVFGSDELGHFLRDTRLEIGNQDHIEKLRALEFVQLLYSEANYKKFA